MDAAIGLDGLLDPLSRCFDAESARRLVELRVEPPVQERIDVLGARANEGSLSADECAEHEALINAADFISILKLKARRHLDHSAVAMDAETRRFVRVRDGERCEYCRLPQGSQSNRH